MRDKGRLHGNLHGQDDFPILSVSPGPGMPSMHNAVVAAGDQYAPSRQHAIAPEQGLCGAGCHDVRKNPPSNGQLTSKRPVATINTCGRIWQAPVPTSTAQVHGLVSRLQPRPQAGTWHLIPSVGQSVFGHWSIAGRQSPPTSSHLQPMVA